MSQIFNSASFKKSKIIISLIHNNEEERLSLVRPQINDLILKLKNKMEVRFCEISWQPILKPASLYVGLLKDLASWELSREWAKHREITNKLLLIDFLFLIKKEFIKYILKPEISKEWLNTCTKELFLSEKHLKAFTLALEDKADYLLVFESDTVFKKDSIDKISALLDNLETTNKIPTYIDLAGGIQINELKIDKLELKKDKDFRYYKKPVTNTTGCYLVNQGQLKIFNNYLATTPMLRYIAADWLLNKLFMLQIKTGIISECRHANPPFFNHGSVTGEFQSSIQ